MKTIFMAIICIFTLFFINNLSFSANQVIPSNVDPELSTQIRILANADPVERARAASKLGSMREKAKPAVPFLLNLLNDESDVYYQPINVQTTVAAIVIYALHDIGDPQSIVPMIESVRRHCYLVSAVSHALYEMWSKVDSKIVPQYLSDSSPCIRGMFVWLLGEKGDVSALHLLQELLRDRDQDNSGQELRIMAAQAITNIINRLKKRQLDSKAKGKLLELIKPIEKLFDKESSASPFRQNLQQILHDIDKFVAK